MVFIHLRMSNGGGGKITPPPGVSRVLWHLGKNSNGYTHGFKVKRFNGANSYVAGSRYVTGNRYGGKQTGNNFILGYRTARQIISTCFSTFSTVRYTMVQ